jgi:hypothetical protein
LTGLAALQTAFEHFQSQAALKEKAESDRNTAFLIGGLALFILAAASKKPNQNNNLRDVM